MLLSILVIFLSIQIIQGFAIPEQQPLFKEDVKVELPLDHHEGEHVEDYYGGSNETLHINYKTPNDLKVLGLDPKSSQFSGYLNTNDHKKLFFWLFLSRSDPNRDPLILWQNGGPGCSSLYGAFRQWGPKIMNDKGDWIDNPALLNDNANLLFVEAPIAVGFSTFETGFYDAVDRTPQYTRDMMAFLDTFFKTTFNGGGVTWIPNNCPFHIGGESYAGHYIPNLASTMLDAGNPFQLRSIFVGNGWYDALTQREDSVDMLCNKLNNPNKKWPMLQQEDCTEWRSASLDCENEIKVCRGTQDDKCRYRMTKCHELFSAGSWAGTIKRDPYDLTRKRKPGADRNNAEGGKLEEWVAGAAAIVGADERKKTWVMCIDRGHMVDSFRATGDWYFDFTPYLANILAHNIPILMYAGDTDLMCPYHGVLEVAKNIQWPGRATFNAKAAATPYPTLRMNNKDYADYIKEGRLMYVRVYGAGHMINENQPPESKNMITAWLRGELGQ